MLPLLCRVLPYLLPALVALVFFRHTLFGGAVIPWDLQGFHLPHLHLYADALSRGELPLWDPYTYCGRPFQANIQTQVFYPTVAGAALLTVWLGHDVAFYLLELNVVLHTALAGMFAIHFGRVLGLSFPPAILLGLAYQCGAFFAIHAEHMGAITVAAWLPFTWAAVWECSRSPSWRAALALAAGLAMSILGGLTPLTVVVAATVALLGLLQVVVGKASVRILLIIAASGGAALLLTLAQLGPTLQLTYNSIAQYRTDWLKTGGGVPLEALITLVIPNYWGAFDLATYRLPSEITFSYLYTGLGVLLLAAVSVAAIREPAHGVFAVMSLMTGLAMLGDSTPIGRFVYASLPADLRAGLHPEYTMPAFLLSVCVLAALACHRWASVRMVWLITLVCVIDVVSVNSGRPWHAMAREHSPPTTRNSFAGYTASVEALRALTEQAEPPWRFDTIHGAMPWAMEAPIFAIPTANGNDPMALARVISARLSFTGGERWGGYYEPQDLGSRALDALNIRYLVSRQLLSDMQDGGAKWTLAAEVPGFNIYENPQALPRFWLVSQVLGTSNEAQSAARFRRIDFAPADEAVVEGMSSHFYGSEPGGQVRVLSYGLKQLDLEVDAPHPMYLVSSEAHYPGWRAALDGAGTALHYTNVAFRGMVVPAGKHRIRMIFEPSLLIWCGLVSGISWAVWLLLWFTVGRRSLRPTSASARV